ncbi:serine/threonine-protein kinase [Microcoleus sp. FACHB-672]|uniref:serine/threonine-protein kinase n=1 Tax=Microcoleus sp. FACHB-672 TaxID=2692825 RepID=UPI001682915E|nr:serine/threonine-protein kinase [Microcoleus sp. FACHB-672]MBD2040669.1 tetratricopeptide repeat protein [Microcoleus sp. FACHB-672]
MLKTTLSGRYHIISHLGGGGFGQTYLAEDRQLPGNHQCVVKQLKPQANDPATLQTARRLFDTEAQVLYKLGKHERIPQLFAYFEEDQEFYLVQEFVEGRDLGKELSPSNPGQNGVTGGSLSEDEVICLLQDILEVLEFVHQQNVIHRDINPSNIIRRNKDSKLVLIDFGAVKQITTQVQPAGQTCVSVSIGTPGYMPSEQAHGNPKPSSDVYAVGIIGIQALTGLLPHQFEKDADTEEIIWRERVSVSPELAEVLDKMVRYDFRQRYPSASEALQALKELKNPVLPTKPVGGGLPVKAKKSQSKLLMILISLAVVGSGIGLASVSIVNSIHSSNANDLYSRGNTLYNLKRYEEALESYTKAIKIKPDYAEAWKDKANALSSLKQQKEALEAYEKAIQIKPDYLEAWLGRSYVLDNLKRYEEAIASLDEALKIQPTYSEAWNGRGEVLLKVPRYEEAITSYEKAIEIRPDYYEAWYNRGWALHNLQRYEDAVASYDKAVEFKSDYYKAWHNRGNSFLKLNRYKDAVESYDKAVRLKPDYFQAWYSKGNALSNLKRYQDAIESYQKAVQLKPDSYEAWYNLGWSLHQLRRYEEAFGSYDKVIQLQPNDAQAWYNRGNALYNLKRYEQAVNSYDSAVYIKPDNYEAWYSRGNALFSLKRYEDAMVSYEKAVQLKPNFREAIKAQKEAERQLEATNPPILEEKQKKDELVDNNQALKF